MDTKKENKWARRMRELGRKEISTEELKDLKKLRTEIEGYKQEKGIYNNFEKWIWQNADNPISIRERYEKFKSINNSINDEIIDLFLKYANRYNDESSVDNLPIFKRLLENKMGLLFSEEEFYLLVQNLEFVTKVDELVNYVKEKEYNLDELASLILDRLIFDYEKTAKEYIEHIIDELIKKTGIKLTVDEILKKINEIEQKRELDNFEEKLLRTEKSSSKKEIQAMSGLEFEKFIASCFKKKGYNLKITKATGDQGADIILEDKKGVLIAVQIKKYVGSVGNKAVQEVVASMKFYDCDKAMVITTGTFTKSAFELASKNGVQLIDKKGLDDLI